jgi:hypothetical protein
MGGVEETIQNNKNPRDLTAKGVKELDYYDQIKLLNK